MRPSSIKENAPFYLISLVICLVTLKIQENGRTLIGLYNYSVNLQYVVAKLGLFNFLLVDFTLRNWFLHWNIYTAWG